MELAKGAWKILMAVKDGLVLLLLILFFAGLYGVLSATPNSASVKEGALLLDIDGVITEQPAEIDWRTYITEGGGTVREYRTSDIVRALETARDDERVKAVVLDLDFFLGGGQTSLSAVGDALDAFKKSGKPVYSFASFYGDDAYQLAAHASEIWVDPMGGAVFAGPGGNQLYYKDLIDRLGLTANIYRVGTYKSFVEPYIRSDQSPEAKEALKAVYDVLWQSWQADVAKARPKAKIADFIANPAEMVAANQGDLVKLAKQSGLIDKVGLRADFERHVAKVAGVDEDMAPDSYKAIALADWTAGHPPETADGRVGVITVAGDIISGDAGPGTAASGRIAAEIYGTLEDNPPDAMVVRVDSPGGSAFASEEIRAALLAVRKAGIPVVISMGDVAASGGYWVATGGDVIFAEPDTITGSIGIFAILPSAEKALVKWGVGADGVKTTALSGEPDFAKGPGTAFNAILQSNIEHNYRQFLSRVASARKKTPEQVDSVAQGRVWDGGTARQLGLVDRLGGLDEAAAEAAKRAGLAKDGYAVEFIETPAEFPGFISGLLMADVRSQANYEQSARGLIGWSARQQQSVIANALANMERIFGEADIQAYCLECPAKFAAPSPRTWAATLAAYFGAR